MKIANGRKGETKKCYVNCEIGLDGDGYACIFAIKNITPEPLYSVYSMSNLPSQDINYEETIEVSIQSVYFDKKIVY